MDLDTTLSGYGVIYLLCGHGGETLVLGVTPGFSLDALWDSLRARWNELDRSRMDMHYSLPDFPRVVLADETDIKAMIDLIISYGLVRVKLDISYGGASNNILANDGNDVDNEDVLGKLIPKHENKLLTAGWENLVSKFGKKFEGGAKEFRLPLWKTAIGGGFQFQWVRNDILRVTAICADEKCVWFVHASVENDSCDNYHSTSLIPGFYVSETSMYM